MNSPKQYSLSASERIKSRKDFELIYSSGKTVYSSDKKFKAIYVISTETEKPGVKIAPVVSRKAGIAVWRNRVKRLIRESYRLNKEILSGISLQRNVLIKIVFSPNLLSGKNNRIIRFKEAAPAIIEIMLKIRSILE